MRACVRRAGRALLMTVVLGAAAVSTARAELRVGYVDSQRIFNEATLAKEAQARFDRQVQGWRDEAAEKEKQVTQLRQELGDQAAILSALRRQEKETALQSAVRDYEKFIQDIWGPGGRAQRENDGATSEIVNQIRTAVEKIAGERGLGLVLDSAAGFILYAERSMDLTVEVVTELNSRSTTGGSR